MKRNMLCLLFSLILIQINGISLLTGENNDQGGQTDKNAVPTKRVDILQQLLNQETIIRMSLEKSVRDLMKEVADMKEIQIENLRLERNSLIQLKENLTRIEYPELLTEKCEQMYESMNRSLEILNNELTSRHKQLSENVSNLEIIHRDNQGVIAFNALLTADQKRPAKRAVIIFKKVTLNSGNAYDATTGKFTAPADGIFSFTWTIATNSGHLLSTEIVNNDKPVSYNHVNGRHGNHNYETGSTTANIEMKKNEKVWIRAYEDGYARPTWSSFSGFQLKK
ncbi:heavy metal-binding protein HIP-like [Saccostrea echinata]|uniref:heavy metal-binding protein HIP-like n=1 Tax=Saccostrea echinata TaxID=191078 RepID=UPI002A80E1C3|nr:heavy metal-binding protein HIP-like [Saccostrea echinata]